MDSMPIEKYEATIIVGPNVTRGEKTRCKLCLLETKDGHPVTVCLYAMRKKMEYLEARLNKAGIK